MTKDLIDSKGDEISISELKRMIRMTSESFINNSIKSMKIWING
jgi:hypothetical protein